MHGNHVIFHRRFEQKSSLIYLTKLMKDGWGLRACQGHDKAHCILHGKRYQIIRDIQNHTNDKLMVGLPDESQQICYQ